MVICFFFCPKKGETKLTLTPAREREKERRKERGRRERERGRRGREGGRGSERELHLRELKPLEACLNDSPRVIWYSA